MQKFITCLLFVGKQCGKAFFQKLGEGGVVLVPLAQYPPSKKFGWLTDRFGVSWQLNLAK